MTLHSLPKFAAATLACLGLSAALPVATGVGPLELVASAHAQGTNCYATFYPSNYRGLTLTACSESGSGSYTLRNNTGQTMRACWDVIYRDASSNGGRCTTIRNGQSEGYSCWSCNPRNGGPAVDVEWQMVEPR
jgi:hypothetical protein